MARSRSAAGDPAVLTWFSDPHLLDSFHLLRLATQVGGPGNDILYGSSRPDRLVGNDGHDVLWGFGGNDLLEGGNGDDVLDGGDGKDILLGGDRNDFLAGRAGSDLLLGGAGHDRMYGGTGADWLAGGAGNDVLFGGGGGDTLVGGTGNDYLKAGGSLATLAGGTGNDWYFIGSRSATQHYRDATIVEHAGQGIDSVQTTVDFNMSNPVVGAANIENLYLDDGNYHPGDPAYTEPDWDIHAVGNALGNHIYGNLGDNIVEGAAGNDTFHFHSYEVDLQDWPPISPTDRIPDYRGATLDQNDFVYGGTQAADAGQDALFAVLMDFSGILHIHGVEEITFYSGRTPDGFSNNVDASDIVGARQITVTHLLPADYPLDENGFPIATDPADTLFTNLAAGTQIRIEEYDGNVLLSLADGQGAADEVTVTVQHFFQGRDGGTITTVGIETLVLRMDEAVPANAFSQFSIDSPDLQHVVLTGATDQVFLLLQQTNADLRIADTDQMTAVVRITDAGTFRVGLDDAVATLVPVGESPLLLDTTGTGGASDLSLVAGELAPVTVIGNQDLRLTFSEDGPGRIVNALGMTGNLDVTAGLGDDQITGGAGNDRLNAGAEGADVLFGSGGADRFVFDDALGAPGHSVTIGDFASGIDDFVLEDAIFTGVATGTLAASEFYQGDVAGISGQHFAFDAGTGGLFYDADGIAGGSIAFAAVQAGAAVAHTDITIV